MANNKFCTECGNEIHRSTYVCGSCGYDSKNEMIHETELEKGIFSFLEPHTPRCYKCKDLLSDEKIKELKKVEYVFCETCFPYDVNFSFTNQKDFYNHKLQDQASEIYRKMLAGEYSEHYKILIEVKQGFNSAEPRSDDPRSFETTEEVRFLNDYIISVILKKKWKLW